ncbi:TetR/AcrR family transcriptional regulator [Phenylobacterium sp.]|uniref:TetR/AcrR family transcriptional regulator n=1 Tax=Phenylobacterium sp. TaxID=1871053 RepID=UPI002732054D|nr:TetR/AcrR family transcriptional regulator [Phenylobacterium sp.]MDP1617780.1 TetR/AcrR family transcriptional regulator [Phenylobacterium sp.]MDP1986797.1 TetR/AcrR family transcriptional regulator [Phenylobacterium sp.]
MNLRQTQKEATRRRVLDAARDLFETVGYEETTVREIASQAGVAVGSVFTCFSSKAEVLSQVMQERLDDLYGELDRVTPHLRGSTADRLSSIFALHFAFETRRTQLFLAHIAAAYSWRPGGSSIPYGRNPRLRGTILDCVAEGQERGDVDPALDLDMIVDMLMAAYAWNYRLAAWENAGPERMSANMEQQIALLARGFRPLAN